MSYEYKKNKKEILKILNSKTPIEQTDCIPADSEFNYDNGIKTWVCSLFVDIVDSTTLFSDSKISKDILARIIRSFTDGIIQILNDNENLYDCGIRGDSVFGIFQGCKKDYLVSVFKNAYRINTFINMFNELLEQNKFPPIKAGIGLGCGYDLVIKVGHPRIAHDKVWIGDAVFNAANLSKIANRNGYDPICIDYLFYFNTIDELCKFNPKYKEWIEEQTNSNYNGTFYDCNIVESGFDKWINNGMKDE